MKSITALALLGALAGCNTVEGIGRDLALGGEAIEEAATGAQQPQPAQPQTVYQPVPQQQPIYRQQPVAPYNPSTAPPPNNSYTY